MLEMGKREASDPRTLGTLFHTACDEMKRIGFTEALALLLTLLDETLNSVIGLCKEQVKILIQRFIDALPRAFREPMLLLAPECS